jgi:hypothetical protein
VLVLVLVMVLGLVLVPEYKFKQLVLTAGDTA